MKSVAIVIARFQTPYLHVGHSALLAQAARENTNVLVLLGVSAVPSSARNPLSFDQRACMVHEFARSHYGGTFTTVPLFDMPSHEEWVQQVERIANSLFPSHQKAIYGSRDSALDHYIEHGGVFETRRTEAIVSASATPLRAKVRDLAHSTEFRQGVIWASQQQYRHVYAVVDMAIVHGGYLLLARKTNDAPGKWRLIGGFVDKGESLEQAAFREVKEETGLELETATYAGSCFINDWRYEREDDGITSAIFLCEPKPGQEEVAQDDIAEVRWFPVYEASARIHQNHAEALTLALRQHAQKV